MVIQDSHGWHSTPAGRERLSTLELLSLLSCALDETLIPTID
jgi:hypothetical protein